MPPKTSVKSPKRCTAPTARGGQCKRPASPGALVCTGHLGTSRGPSRGRPSKLNEDVTNKLVAILRNGGYVETAIAAAGISRATYFAWMERGDPARNARRDLPFREFRQAIEVARGEGEAQNVAMVAMAASKDWRAAAWMLERQFPDRWGGPRAKERAGGFDEEDRDPNAASGGDGPRLIDDQIGPDGRSL